MSKLSKTAQAAMNAVARGQQKEKVELTPEEKLRQIRLNLDARLWIPPDQQRWLLAQYDAAIKQLADEQEKRVGQLDIIKRTLERDDDAFLANDYGGLNWEQGEPMETIRHKIALLQKIENREIVQHTFSALLGGDEPVSEADALNNHN